MSISWANFGIMGAAQNALRSMLTRYVVHGACVGCSNARLARHDKNRN